MDVSNCERGLLALSRGTLAAAGFGSELIFD
jgi:hypothetical protein